MPNLSPTDANFLRMAYEEALAGFNEGGCPIGSVLAERERLIARGRNQRVQQGDPIAHGEMDCLRKAGRHALALRLANTEEQRAVDGVLAAIHEELAR